MAHSLIRYPLLILLAMLHCSISRAQDEPASNSHLSPLHLETETLENGLRVIYVPVHQTPIVHVRVLYHVGSKDERPDRQGFAHMFEHMMFRGSAHVGEQDFVRLVRAAGGSFNGETSQDITSYFQTLPKNQLALALYLEADRMASFRVTPQIFGIERNVVIEEISLKHDDPILGLREELIDECFRSNSYRWTALGNPKQLMAANVEELQQFFDRFYVPNNAVIVLTGDFDPAAAKKLVHDDFGWIARGADVTRPGAVDTAPAARRIEITRPVSGRALMLACRVPPFGSEDDAALIALEQAIKIRVLPYLTVEDNHLASHSFTHLMQLENDGCLGFGVTLLPGADLAKAERIVNIRLQLLRDEGILASEAQFKSLTDAIIADLIRQKNSPEGLSDQIGRGLVLRNEPDAIDQRIGRLRKLTAPMFRLAAQKYLKPDAMTLMIVRPLDSHVVPTPQSEPPVAPVVQTLATERNPVSFPPDYPNKPHVEPPMVPVVANSVGEIHVHGLTALFVAEPQSEIINMRFWLPHGWQDDPAGKEGLGRLALGLLEDSIAKPPISLTSKQEPEHTEITISVPIASADHLFDDLGPAMRQPLKPYADYRLFPLKWQLFNEVKAMNEQSLSAAEVDSLAALFGDSPLGRSVSAASLRAISRDDLSVYRNRLFDFNGATVVIRGNITAERARALLEKLPDDQPRLVPISGPLALATVAPTSTRPRIILIDAPESRESILRIGSRVWNATADEQPASELAGSILSQRIFRTVRSDLGYAYIANVEFEQLRSVGLFTFQTATSVGRTGATIASVLSNIAQLAGEGASENELNDAKSGVAGRAVMQLHTAQQQAAWRADALLRGDHDDVAQHVQRISAVTAAQVQQLFARYTRSEELVIVVIAPANDVKSDLASIGDVEVRPMPNLRPGAATRPAYEEIPRPMM